MRGAFWHHCRLVWHDVHRLISQMLTLVMALILFGFMLSHHRGELAREILILASYLVLTLSLSPLFQEDIRSGFMEAYIAAGQSVETWVVTKTLVTWLANLLPLLFISFIFCQSMGPMESTELFMVLGVQVFASFIVVMLSAINSVLTLNVPHSALLLPLLSLPLMVPSLLVSFSILEDPTHTSYFCILAGLCCISVSLSWVMTPFAIRLVLR